MKLKLLRQILFMSKYAFYGLSFQLFLCSFLWAKDGKSQNVKKLDSIYVSLNLNDLTLNDAFEHISEQTDFLFSYKLKKSQLEKPVKINTGIKNVSLGNVLRDLSIAYGLGFKRINENIFVKKHKRNEKVVEEVISESFMQQKVSGKIISAADGEPLPGVSILIKGTSNGTTSNLDGNFTLEVMPEDVLKFSYIGYQSQELTVGNQTQINLSLQEDQEQLEEVIVVGYGTQKKASVTGSVASVDAEDLTVVPASNTTQLLAGRLPGLIVDQNTGRPGSDDADLFIRGFGANNGTTRDEQNERPLVVVDGFIRDFTQLDPNEIESITILKDASAAVYGVRSSAGVILVTTKRGIVGKPEITYNGSYTLSANTTFPEYANYLSYKKIWENRRDGGDAAAGITPSSGYITTDRYNALESGADPGTDWWDEVTRPYAPMQNHNLNIRGGTEKTKYFVSLGYVNQGTLWETNDEDFKRFNTTVNLDTKISNNLSASFNLGWRREDREAVNGGNDIFTIGFAHPAMPINIPGNLNPMVNPANPWSPVVSTNRDLGGYIDTQNDVLNGSLGLDLKVPQIKGLTLGVKGALLQTYNKQKNLQRPFSLYAFGDNGFIEQNVTALVGLQEYSARSTRITTNISANYGVQLGKHRLDALLLGEWLEDFNENHRTYANILTPNVPYLQTADPSSLAVASNANEYGRAGLVGRLNYNFMEKYLVELSFRQDKSAYFPEETRTGFFPGASVGWVISNEGFFDNINFVNRLKLRASAARLGNDQANGYAYIEGFNVLPVANSAAGNAVHNGYVFNGAYQSAIRSTGTPNYSIGWQQADLYNLGVEMLFLDSKLGIEFEGFYRRRFDLLELDNNNVNLPSTVGSDEPLRNVESLTNRGLEAVVSYREIIGEVSLSVKGNVAWSREKYDLNLEPQTYDDPDLDRINLRSGQWVNRTFGYQFDGFFKDQEEIDALPLDYFNGQNSQLVPGDIKVKDINNDGIIDNRDQVVIGKSNVPELSFGLSTVATWKNFDFTMFWQGAAGFHQTITGEERGLSIPVNGPRTPFEYVADRIWTTENLGEGAEFPVDLLGITNNLGLDKYTLDSRYVRLKNLVVGYAIPKDILNKIGAVRLRVYMGATNLITFDSLGFYPFDPESGGRSTYPNQRTYTLGVNLTF